MYLSCTTTKIGKIGLKYWKYNVKEVIKIESVGAFCSIKHALENDTHFEHVLFYQKKKKCKK